MSNRWHRDEAVALCKQIEAVCPKYGCHVALTGGLLYKEGTRKDCDLLFYRIRQRKEIDLNGLWRGLKEIGVTKKSGFGWCFKAVWKGRNIDFFFPEEEEGIY